MYVWNGVKFIEGIVGSHNIDITKTSRGDIRQGYESTQKIRTEGEE